jgi:uncharacterized membrane protein
MKTNDEKEDLKSKKQNKWWVKYVWTAAVIAAIYIFNKATEEYCFEEKRKLSDKEFILIALDNVIKSGYAKLTDLDNTPEKFLKQHPSCCHVYDKEHFAEGVKDVTVIFEMTDKQRKINNSEEVLYMYSGKYTACGFEYDSTGYPYKP